MDNQQERQVAEARLAMLYDTEGTISLRVVRRSRDRDLSIVPYIQFSNTDVGLIEWAVDTLKALNVGCYVQWVKPHGVGKLAQGRVIVAGLLRVKTLIPHLKPWMLVKGRNLDRVEEFINSRLSHSSDPYTDREMELANQCRSYKGGAKRQPVSSETIRRTATSR